MVYVFTFLGEFGYELLNWQGRVRRFAGTIGPEDAIVCCGRGALYPVYEMASQYIDIGGELLLKASRSRCYWASIPGAGSPVRWHNRAYDGALRARLRRAIGSRLGQHRDVTYVFSSVETTLSGITFGCDPGRLEMDSGIFESLDLDANLYRRIEPDLRLRPEIERQLGFDLTEPYVLVQTRTRRVGPQSMPVPNDRLVKALAARMRVVLLSFDTGRALDSTSAFDSALPGAHYSARSFPEQGCLVHYAAHCVFPTEGDFGSHVYVPPFMGKDVWVIAPAQIFTLGTTPIEFYNREVFRFGGRIVAKVSETVLASDAVAAELAGEILSSPSASRGHR